jgi:hypothetical protein
MSAPVLAECAVTKPRPSCVIVSLASSATLAHRSTASSLARLEGCSVSKRCGINVERLVVTSQPSRTAPDSQPEAGGLHASTPRP